MAVEIGELFETPGEFRCEWKISDFTSLMREIDKFYYSPRFIFSNSCWCLRIHPNGETKKNTKGCVAVYVMRDDYVPPEIWSPQIFLSLAIKLADGDEKLMIKGFLEHQVDFGIWALIKHTYLERNKKVMLPSGVFTIICTLVSDAPQRMESSLFRRLWNLSLSLKNLLNTRKSTDVVLKLQDGEIPAHRIILESRSAVFSRMFCVDMRETQTGEVSIEDGNEEAFKVVLSYVYSGEPEGLCSENAHEVYKAAHKYDLRELRKFCVDIIERSLTVDVVSDVIQMAELYQDTTLKNCGKIYFTKNKIKLLKTKKWARMKKENPTLAFEVLEYDAFVDE